MSGSNNQNSLALSPIKLRACRVMMNYASLTGIQIGKLPSDSGGVDGNAYSFTIGEYPAIAQAENRGEDEFMLAVLLRPKPFGFRRSNMATWSGLNDKFRAGDAYARGLCFQGGKSTQFLLKEFNCQLPLCRELAKFAP
jgi:hypothetical protein